MEVTLIRFDIQNIQSLYTGSAGKSFPSSAIKFTSSDETPATPAEDIPGLNVCIFQ